MTAKNGGAAHKAVRASLNQSKANADIYNEMQINFGPFKTIVNERN